MLTLVHPEGLELPPTGIIRIQPDAPKQELRVRARQMSALMRKVQEFYMAPPPEGLGLERIDKDPLPDPENDKLTDWRIGRFRQDRLTYFGAYALDESGQIPDDHEAMVGIALLERWQTYTELVEWDVTSLYRRKHLGIGKAMLQGALGCVPPEREMKLDVVEGNVNSIALYERYGFRFTGQTVFHDTFNAHHLRYAVPSAGVVQENLGGLTLCQERLALIAA